MGETGSVGSNLSNLVPLLLPSSNSSSNSGSSSASTGNTGSAAGSAASLTPTAQLLSSLIALQSEAPNQFSQIVSQIAGHLQTAAEAQGQSGSGQYLQQLATNFQNVANTGDIMQLLPQSSQAAQASQTYGSNGQSLPSSSGFNPTDSVVQQLLTNLMPQS